MPQISIRGIQSKKVTSISKEMINELQGIIDCPRDYFTIEVIDSVFIMDGVITEGYPFVEVSWFDRGQEVQDKVAKSITRFIHNLGYKNVDVIFKVFEENKYYENGQHF